MKRSPSWKPNRSSAGHEIPRILCNAKIHHHALESLQPMFVRDQILHPQNTTGKITVSYILISIFGQGMWHVWRKGEVCTRFWWGNLRERDHWGDQDVGGRIILRWILRKWEGVVGTGWSWLRIGTGGGRL